jgi:hypothetical protein
VIAKKPANLFQVLARLLGQCLVIGHGFHPGVTLRQGGSFKTPNFSFQKEDLARPAVAAAKSIGPAN